MILFLAAALLFLGGCVVYGVVHAGSGTDEDDDLEQGVPGWLSPTTSAAVVRLPTSAGRAP